MKKIFENVVNYLLFKHSEKHFVIKLNLFITVGGKNASIASHLQFVLYAVFISAVKQGLMLAMAISNPTKK